MIAVIIGIVIEVIGVLGLIVMISVWLQFSTGILLNIDKTLFGLKLRISGTKGKEISLSISKEK